MAEGITIEEGHKPVQERDETTEDPGEDAPDNVSVLGFLLLGHGTCLTEHVDKGNDQTSETDATERIGCRPLEGTASSTSGQTARCPTVVVPRAIDTSNRCMNCVLEPLAEPVHSECDINYQTNDLGPAAATTGTGWIIPIAGWFKRHIDGNQRHREPSRERDSHDATDKAHEKHVSGAPSDVDGSLQHQSAERNAGNPADEAYYGEDAENQEDDTGAPLVSHEIVNSSSDGKDDVENACDPDKEFREVSSTQEVGPGKGQGDTEDEDEQDQCVGIQREGIRRVVDTVAIEAFVLGISVDRVTRHCNKPQEACDELFMMSVREALVAYVKKTPTKSPAHISLNLGFSILNTSSYDGGGAPGVY